MISFISNFISHIVGICIGIAGGAVLGIAISAILRQFGNKILTTLFAVVFGILGAGLGYTIQDKYFIDHSFSIPSPTEQVEALDKNLKNNWSNTNGGFTFEEIEKSQNDDDCPICDDQIIDLKCHDFGSYITFSLNNNGTYYNIMFTQTENGLVLDGVMNTTATVDRVLIWWLPPLFGFKDSTFRWNFEFEKEPYFNEVRDWFGIFKYDNLVSLSRQSVKFVTTYADAVDDFNHTTTSFVLNNANMLTSTMASSHFIKFGNVELIGTSEEAFVKINSFYNYLYNEIKGFDYDTTELIDATSALCAPIPEGEKVNHPIPTDKKSEYGDKDYYGTYRCNIAVNLTFVKGNNILSVDNSDYIKKIQDDEEVKNKIKVDDIKPQYSYSRINLNFLDKGSSDLTNVDLLNTPIVITFTAGAQTKTVIVDSKDKLNKGVSILLHKNTSWNYTINSEALIFDDFRGTISLRNNRIYLLGFEYYYIDNFVLASVGLNPVGTIDSSLINLQNNPVKIILSNDNHDYQFTFDDNSLLNSKQNMLVEMGEYTYTILSKQLVFASVTGKLTITSTDKIMLFNYALTSSDSPLTFNVNISKTSASAEQILLSADTEAVALIKKHLSSASTFDVTCVIYDEDGKLIETFNHEHVSSSTICSDIWYPSNLVSGEKYTLQLRFADADDSSITYLSDITTFTFAEGSTFTVNYTVTENT